MSKTRDTGFLNNVVKTDSQGNVFFVSGSTTLLSISSSGAVTTTGVISGSNALSSSYALNADQVDGLNSTSFVFTSSYNTDSSSVSTRVTRIEGNYATTGSNVFLGAQTVCANITSTGTIIAQTLNVQQVTSSVVYSSGSNVFGCSLANTQQFTGSVTMTGSLNVAGTVCTPTLLISNQTNISPNTNGDGQLMVQGNGYGGYIAMDATAMNFGHNSQIRNLTLQTNESSRFSIDGDGVSCFACQICTTSAALSGNVIFNRANTSAGNNIEWRTASTLNWYIGTRGLVNNNFYFVNEGLGANNLILDATSGVATFACNVTVNSTITAAQSTAETSAIVASSGWSGTINNPIITFGRVALAVAGQIGYDDPNTGLYIGTCTNHRLAIRTNNTDRLVISNTGIATFACQVCAPSFIGGTVSGTSATVSNTGTACTVTDVLTLASQQTGGSSVCAGAGILFTGNAGATVARIYSRGNMNFNNGSDLVFQTQVSAGGTPQCTMVINGGSQNVGIGTFNPGYKLDVYRGSSGVVLNLQGVDDYDAETGILMTSGRAKISGFLNPSGGTPGSNLRFYTMPDGGSVTERMRINSDGIACFASTVCTPLLSVNAAVRLYGNASGIGCAYIVTAAGADQQPAIILEKSGGYGQSEIRTYYSNVPDYGLAFRAGSITGLYLNSNGTVSIPSPATGISPLYISQNQSANGYVVVTGDQRIGAGSSIMYEYVGSVPAAGNACVIVIPFQSQGSLHTRATMEIHGVSAEYNANGLTGAFGGIVAFEFLNNINVATAFNLYGALCSISTLNNCIKLNLNRNYNAGLSNYEGVTIRIKLLTTAGWNNYFNCMTME